MTDYQQNHHTILVLDIMFGFCFNFGVILLMYNIVTLYISILLNRYVFNPPPNEIETKGHLPFAYASLSIPFFIFLGHTFIRQKENNVLY